MNLTEIKNMDKNELIEYLDLYQVEAFPDESKRSLRMKAIDLFWTLKDNNGYGLGETLMKVKSIGSNQTEVSANGCRVLYSYETPVALQAPSGKYYKTDRKWSVTTSKHINRWVVPNTILVSQDLLDDWQSGDFA